MSGNKYDWLNEPQYSPLVNVNILHRNCCHVAEETLEEYNELPDYEAVPDKENTYYSRYIHWCSFCLEQGKHLEHKGESK